MHIRKKGVRRTEEVFDVDGKRIEVVEEFTYLGFVVPEQMGGQEDGGGKGSSWVKYLE